MKIFGVLITILFSSCTSIHGHQNYKVLEAVPVEYKTAVVCDDGLVKLIDDRPAHYNPSATNGASYGPAVYTQPIVYKNLGALPSHPTGLYKKHGSPVSYEALPIGPYDLCDGPVTYKNVLSGVPISYQKNPRPIIYGIGSTGPSNHKTNPVSYGAVAIGPYELYDGPVTYKNVPSNVPISYQKNARPIIYGAGSSGPSKQKTKPVSSGAVSVGPYKLCDEPVSYKNVPSGVPISYQKKAGPISYGVVPVPAVPSKKNAVPVMYGSVPTGVSMFYVGPVGYEAVPVPYKQNFGPVVYKTVPSGVPITYENDETPEGYVLVPNGPAGAYQQDVPLVNQGSASAATVSISYQQNLGSSDYKTVPSDVYLSYQKTAGPAAYDTAPGVSISYQKTAGAAGYNTAPGVSISYQKNAGLPSNYAPSYINPLKSGPSYPTSKGTPAVVVTPQSAYYHQTYEVSPYPSYKKTTGPVYYKKC